LGFEVDRTPVGLSARVVHDGTYAARGGVEAGDLLLTLGGAPVIDHRDLATLSRVIAPGDSTASTWARGTDRREVVAQA
jgi:S1-C subfamily serine protease